MKVICLTFTNLDGLKHLNAGINLRIISDIDIIIIIIDL